MQVICSTALLAATIITTLINPNLSSSISSLKPRLGPKTTALEVINYFKGERNLNGKTVIVTGGNSGIGLETCKAMYGMGANVIVCARSKEAAEIEIGKIKSDMNSEYSELSKSYDVSTGKLTAVQLDLSNLGSISECAREIKGLTKNIDVLVLNAGIMALPKAEYTSAGFERQIGVNHFGHFYLSSLLVPGMTRQKDSSRVVVLASTAHTFGDVDTNDLHFTKGRKYTPWGAYGQSKLANLLFAKSLADKLKGTNVNALSVHPGVIKTNLWKSSGLDSGLLGWVTSSFVMDKTVPQGTASTMWASLSPRVDSDPSMRGVYISDCAPAAPNAAGRDDGGEGRERLWRTTSDQLLAALQLSSLEIPSDTIFF